MSAPAVGGWAVAVLAFVVLVYAHLRAGARAEAVARACHELRGPLTGVRLAMSLSARDGGLSRPDHAAVESELARAALALDDLDRTRRRRARPATGTVRRVSLRGLVMDSVAAAQARSPRPGLPVSARWDGADAFVWGDPRRLAQALGNLVANATEHGGGEVRVHGEVRGGMARIVVDDGGPGLPAPVAQLTRRARGGRGARGRGLAIADSVARAHGGSVTGAPARRGGRVVLSLPARRTAERPAA